MFSYVTDDFLFLFYARFGSFKRGIRGNIQAVSQRRDARVLCKSNAEFRLAVGVLVPSRYRRSTVVRSGHSHWLTDSRLLKRAV